MSSVLGAWLLIGKVVPFFFPPGRLSGLYANATSGDKSAITARVLLFFFLFKLIFILLSFLQLMVQGSSLLLAINLNFESEVPRNDGIKLYDNMGVLQGNKRIRQGATQPETSCELLHNWSSAAEDQYWCHNLHHWSWALNVHIIIQAASASWMVWAQSKMNGFQAICFFTSESKSQMAVSGGYSLDHTYCTSSSWDSRSVSILEKHEQVTCEIPQTKDRFSEVLFRQKSGTFLLDSHQCLHGNSAMDLEVIYQEKWVVWLFTLLIHCNLCLIYS